MLLVMKFKKKMLPFSLHSISYTAGMFQSDLRAGLNTSGPQLIPANPKRVKTQTAFPRSLLFKFEEGKNNAQSAAGEDDTLGIWGASRLKTPATGRDVSQENTHDVFTENKAAKKKKSVDANTTRQHPACGVSGEPLGSRRRARTAAQ